MSKRDPWYREFLRALIAGMIFAALFFVSNFGCTAAHAISNAMDDPDPTAVLPDFGSTRVEQ